MDAVELGKKLKDARIARKMTQSEVVGTFITRNMLSQIESGAAMPSIKTLEYLCRVLDLPLGQLMPGETDEAQDVLSQLIAAKYDLATGKYEEIISRRAAYPPELSDEFSAILSRAYLSLAKEKSAAGEYHEAVKLAQASIELADRGLYANTALRTEGMLFFSEIAEKLSDYYAKLHQDEKKDGTA